MDPLDFKPLHKILLGYMAWLIFKTNRIKIHKCEYIESRIISVTANQHVGVNIKRISMCKCGKLYPGYKLV